MSRTKTGFVRRRWHNKVRKMVRGQFGSRGTLWKRSNEAMMKSLFYSYRDRKQRARRLRELWIVRINAASRLNGLSYSKLIYGLKAAGVIGRPLVAKRRQALFFFFLMNRVMNLRSTTRASV